MTRRLPGPGDGLHVGALVVGPGRAFGRVKGLGARTATVRWSATGISTSISRGLVYLAPADAVEPELREEYR